MIKKKSNSEENELVHDWKIYGRILAPKYLSSQTLRRDHSEAEVVFSEEPGMTDIGLWRARNTGPSISSTLNNGANWITLHFSEFCTKEGA